MNAFRARLGIDRDRDSSTDIGFTLVEVVVAIFIFSIVATGSMYAMLSVLQLTRDSRAQQVAANLAAQEIDLSRDFSDLFDLVPTAYTKELNGDVFTVTRQTQWVSNTGNDVQCDAGGANLSYKRVNVTVTWENMRSPQSAVRSDTVIDPKSKISDPTKGTILVFVRNDAGLGTQGVTVTVRPSAVPNGAATPAPNTAVTDATGCAYILKVKEGNYDVTLGHPSNEYVSELQQTTPLANLGVRANTTVSTGFFYDRSGTMRAIYGTNYPTALPIRVPTNLDTTFISTYGAVERTFTSGTDFKLHPFTAGYKVVGGVPQSCDANDPQAWEETDDRASPAEVLSQPLPPNPPVDANVEMGVVQIDVPTLANRYLRAVAVNAPDADDGKPGCANRKVYRFGQILPLGGRVLIALPYGTWQLYADNSATATTTSGGGRIGKGGTNATVLTHGSFDSGDGQALLDPRAPKDDDDDEDDD